MFNATPGCCVYSNTVMRSMSELINGCITYPRSGGTFIVLSKNDDTKDFIQKVIEEKTNSIIVLDDKTVMLLISQDFQYNIENKFFIGDISDCETIDLNNPKDLDVYPHQLLTRHYGVAKDCYLPFGKTLVKCEDIVKKFSERGTKIDLSRVYGNRVIKISSKTHEMRPGNYNHNFFLAGFMRILLNNGDIQISLERFVLPENTTLTDTEIFDSVASEKTRKSISKSTIIRYSNHRILENQMFRYYHCVENKGRSVSHTSFNLTHKGKTLPWVLTADADTIKHILKEKKV
jgi:hypothetical protein